jgi:hypothetical protein
VGKSVKETIVLSETSFKISDNSATPNPYLIFKINEWGDANVPATYSNQGYTVGYKLSGKLVEADPTSGIDSYINSSKTAPSTTASDVKADGSGPSFHIYIYYNEEDESFIRTTFINDNATDNTGAVTRGSDNILSVYQ